MGIVYEVKDRLRDLRMAMKVLRLEGEEHRMRFKREFRSISQLSHPNLVRFYDLFVEDDLVYFTMELIEGVDVLSWAMPEGWMWPETNDGLGLADTATVFFEDEGDCGAVREDVTGRRVCDEGMVRALLSQLMDVLEFLHARGMVHRDLKPGNILVEASGRLKVLDFGIVSLVGEAVSMDPEGAIMGTPDFMSPEQLLGQQAGPEADLYSVGCLLHLLLTGQRPYGGGVWRAVLAGASLDPPQVVGIEGVSDELGRLCESLLKMSPDDRPTIAQVRARLGERRGCGPQQGSVIPEVGFVGRSGELAAFERLLGEARGGSFRMVMLHGETGIGKSALLSRALDRASRRGVEVFQASCSQRERVRFRAFDGVVDKVALCLSALPEASMKKMRSVVEMASPCFPAFGYTLSRSGQHTALAEARSTDCGEMAGVALAEVLEAMASLRPVLLAIDDFQWADPQSVVLLEALVERAPVGVALIVSLTDTDIDETHPLHTVMEDGVGSAPSVSRLELGPLSLGSVHQLIEQVSTSPVGMEVAQRVADHTGGNPFFVIHTAATVSIDSIARSPLPSLDEVIERRMLSLSPEALRVLEVAAAAGGLTTHLLLRSVSGLSSESFERAMGELFKHRIMRRAFHAHPLCDVAPMCSAPGPCRLLGASTAWPTSDFYHSHFHTVAYGRMGPERRASLHRQIAQVLEARAETEFCTSARLYTALALHWREAGAPLMAEFYLKRLAGPVPPSRLAKAPH